MKLFEELAITEEEVAATPIAPTAYHYVSHMYRQLIEGTPKTAAASMLPCSWLYQEIGAQLVKQHSPEPLYQRWIETYAGEEAYQHVQEERQLLDQLYEESSPQEQAAMITAFVISSEMEYAFGKWPIHTKPGLVNTKASRLVLVTNDLFCIKQ